MQIIDAQLKDAQDLAYLLNIAGEGIPAYLWSQMAEEDETPLQVGIRRASREEGGFSYRHARVCLDDARVAGMIVSYRQDSPYDLNGLTDYPEILQPLIELEAMATGSWYINAVAVFEPFRGGGIATRMLQEAEKIALENAVSLMSIIVASGNTGARSLYLKLGYEVAASIPVIPYPGAMHGGDWQLMLKRP